MQRWGRLAAPIFPNDIRAPLFWQSRNNLRDLPQLTNIRQLAAAIRAAHKEQP